MTEPLVLRLERGDAAEIDRVLAVATAAMFAERVALVFCLSDEASRSGVIGAGLRSWFRRHAVALRTRASAVALVVPARTRRWIVWLWLRSDPVSTRWHVAATLPAALAWAEA